MKLYITDHDGNEHQIEGVDGWQLMEAIRDEGCKSRQSAEAHVHARLAMCM